MAQDQLSSFNILVPINLRLNGRLKTLDAFPADVSSAPTVSDLPSVPALISSVPPQDTIPLQAAPSPNPNECTKYLKDFFQDNKPPCDSPVSQFEIDFLTLQFRKENDVVDMAELQKACAKVRLSIPKNLSKKTSSPQFGNPKLIK